MIGYRFKTEEEMIASHGPGWNGTILSFKADPKALGLPFNREFTEYLMNNMSPLSIEGCSGRIVAVRAAVVGQWDKVMFDIKDLELNKALSISFCHYQWNKDVKGHCILYDWITPYYIDAEAWAKRSIEVNKRLKIKLPENDSIS